MSAPALNPAVLLAPDEQGYLAYDPSSDRLYRLNPIASLIAELCDGHRSVDDIHALVDPMLAAGTSDAIDAWIKEGIDSGLLVEAGPPSAGQREFSHAELCELAERLGDEGKLLPLLLCRKKIVDLNANDAAAWYGLGNAAYSLGRRDEAREAYAKYLEFHPEDAALQQIMVALRSDTPPLRAPDECIRQIYRRFSSQYDHWMREELDYQSPERIGQLVRSVVGRRASLSVLDLGCGSGLAGIHLRPVAAELVGVDLSPEMIALARARAIYDRLEIAEISAWLEGSREQFDVIAACEVLVYFGDLKAIALAAARRLKPGGLFAFTVERANEAGYHLMDSGRYAHHTDYVRSVAAHSGLSEVRLEEAFLRSEYGAEVTGLIVALGKSAPE